MCTGKIVAVLPNSLKQRDVTLQRKAISQKLLQVALRTVYLRSFTILASCKSVSTTSFLVTKKFNNQYRQRLSSKFKVNSTCPYIRSIRNCNILIYCYAWAVLHRTVSRHLNKHCAPVACKEIHQMQELYDR